MKTTRFEEVKKPFSGEIFSLSVHLDRKGELSEGFAALFSDRILSVKADGSDPVEIPLAKLDKARFFAYAGACAAEVSVEGEWLTFCRSTASDKRNLSQFVRILCEICDGVLNPENAVFIDRKSVCEKCHRLLPPGSVTCPRCAEKKGVPRRLFAMMRPQIGWILLSMLLFGLTAICNVILPLIQKELVDGYIQSEHPEIAMQAIFSMLAVVASMLLVRVLIVAFSVLRNNLLARISKKTVVSLRHMLYSHIQYLSVAGISKRTAGDLIHRVSRDTEILSDFLTDTLPRLLEEGVTILFVLAIMFSRSWRMTAMILVPVPIVLIVFRLVWKRTHRFYRREWVENTNANTVLHDIFQGVRVVKVFGTEKQEIEKYDKTVSVLRDVSIRTESAWAKTVPFTHFLIRLGEFIVLYFAGNAILHEQMTIGELAMFTSFVTLVYAPLQWMANFPRRLQMAITAVTKIFEILDEEPDVKDSPAALDFPIRGKVELDRVWFGYDENENVLENVSLTVEPGEMLGIVGKSGVGKSTLINLVMRLYDADRGAVRIDGVDVKDIAQHALRSQIGVVLQETFLFSGTIFENLAYAKPEANYEEVIRAARLAHAHEFIMCLPDGYNTYVGVNGYTLSGGERQRIAIARAVLCDPKILILDEATSALDTETEKLVQDAIKKLSANRTTIAIAHRLSTLRNATRLVVLDEKTVAEEGTHEELLEKKGLYYDLVLAQRQMARVKKDKNNG